MHLHCRQYKFKKSRLIASSLCSVLASGTKSFRDGAQPPKRVSHLRRDRLGVAKTSLEARGRQRRTVRPPYKRHREAAPTTLSICGQESIALVARASRVRDVSR